VAGTTEQERARTFNERENKMSFKEPLHQIYCSECDDYFSSDEIACPACLFDHFESVEKGKRETEYFKLKEEEGK
jgi:Zn finger protein HypA/HybF involved in hydrogenase expression|tara:strand:+ start:452 stop:676 length:225 start_codon:yes stop_codon:yes gene_type:complete